MNKLQKLYISNIYLIRFVVTWFLFTCLIVFYLSINNYYRIPVPEIFIPTVTTIGGILVLVRFKFGLRKDKYAGEEKKIVEEICRQLDMDVPALYKRDVKHVGALAFGVTPLSGVLLTDELFEYKQKAIIKGVIAHELAHIKYGHSLSLIATVGVLVMLSFVIFVNFFFFYLTDFFAVMLTAFLVSLIYMYVHRIFERQADNLTKSVKGASVGLKEFLTAYFEKYKKMGINVEKSHFLKRIMSLHPTFKERIRNLS